MPGKEDIITDLSGITFLSAKNAGSPRNPAENLGIEAEYRYGYSMNITRFHWPLG